MPGTKWTPPGERRRKITIQQQATATKTTAGFLKNAWTDVLTTWAAVKVKHLYQFAKAGASEQPIPHAAYILNIRFPPSTAILPGMRVVETDPTAQGATYLIQSVADVDQMHRELDLFCSQIPAPAAQEQ